jgi:hypothetical protein
VKDKLDRIMDQLVDLQIRLWSVVDGAMFTGTSLLAIEIVLVCEL